MREFVVELPVVKDDVKKIKNFLTHGYDQGGVELWKDVISIELDNGECYFFHLRVASSEYFEEGVYEVFVDLEIKDIDGETVEYSDFVYSWDDVYEVYDFKSKTNFVLKIV